MILFCKTIKFAVEEVILRELCHDCVSKSAKSQENLPKMVRKKMPKRAKSQEKVRKK